MREKQKRNCKIFRRESSWSELHSSSPVHQPELITGIIEPGKLWGTSMWTNALRRTLHWEPPNRATIKDENCREKPVEGVTLTTGKKEKWAVDFRCSLLTTSLYVQGTVSSSVQSLLDTMVYMQDILYKEDKHRSSRLILSYLNSSLWRSWVSRRWPPTAPL